MSEQLPVAGTAPPASPTPEPSFTIDQRYTYQQADGIVYIYDYRGVMTRGKHKGCHKFEHRQMRNHYGDLYIAPGDARLQRIATYVPREY